MCYQGVAPAEAAGCRMIDDLAVVGFGEVPGEALELALAIDMEAAILAEEDMPGEVDCSHGRVVKAVLVVEDNHTRVETGTLTIRGGPRSRAWPL